MPLALISEKLAPVNNGLEQIPYVLPGPVVMLIAGVCRNARLSEVLRVGRPQRGRQVGLAGFAAHAGLQDLFGGIGDHGPVAGRVSRASWHLEQQTVAFAAEPLIQSPALQ